MTYTKAQKKATMKWDAEHYDQIRFTAPKGFNNLLTEASKLAGKSKRQFIIEVLTEAIEKEENK